MSTNLGADIIIIFVCCLVLILMNARLSITANLDLIFDFHSYASIFIRVCIS